LVISVPSEDGNKVPITVIITHVDSRLSADRYLFLIEHRAWPDAGQPFVDEDAELLILVDAVLVFEGGCGFHLPDGGGPITEVNTGQALHADAPSQLVRCDEDIATHIEAIGHAMQFLHLVHVGCHTGCSLMTG
jgi:hypothetical protein